MPKCCFPTIPEVSRPLLPTANLGPPGGAKISYFYVFLRILLHLGPSGEPKSRIFMYFAVSGPDGGAKISYSCVFCCIWPPWGSQHLVFSCILACWGPAGSLLGACWGPIGALPAQLANGFRTRGITHLAGGLLWGPKLSRTTDSSNGFGRARDLGSEGPLARLGAYWGPTSSGKGFGTRGTTQPFISIIMEDPLT